LFFLYTNIHYFYTTLFKTIPFTMFNTSIRKLLLLILLLCNLNSSAQVFWTELFNNGCSAGCNANTYVGPNGAWNFTFATINDPDANVFYVSDQENGNPRNSCGSAMGGDATLHIGADSVLIGDLGASFNNGGACITLGICVVTDVRAESPTINCTGKTNITIEFNYMETGDGVIDDADFWYFDGITWASINPLPKTPIPICFPQGQWTHLSFLLPVSANNNPNVKIGFRWVNNDDMLGDDPSFAVDSIQLSTPVPTNNAPTAVSDISSTPTNIMLPVSVLSNDLSNDVGQTTAINSILDNPLHGTVIINGNNIDYTPSNGFCGTDSFQYLMADNGVPVGYDSAWVIITVGSAPPQPGNVTATSPVCLGDTIFFTSSKLAGHTLVWSGPNGFSGAAQNFNIKPAIAAHAGIYSVYQYQFIGCPSPPVNVNVTVNAPPIVNIAVNNNPSCTGAAMTISCNNTPGASYTWSGPTLLPPPPTNMFTWNVSPAVLTDSGMYHVIVNHFGCINEDSILLDVVPCPIPTSNFSFSNDTICSGGTLSFTDLSSNAPSGWNWTFNASGLLSVAVNPSTSTAQHPVCTFTSLVGTPITIQVAMFATNGFGSGGPVTKNIVVMPPPPVANFSWSPAVACLDSLLTFVDLSTNNPTSWAWIFVNGFSIFNSVLQNPSNVKANFAGNYNVLLTATNYCGSNQVIQNVNVLTTPIANFNFNGGNLCAGSPIQFNNSSIGASSFNWNFTNGTSNLPNPVNTFATAGTYNVSLIVSNACGVSTPVVQPVNIYNCIPPVASFITPDTFCMNQAIAINNTSLNVPPTAAIISWTFAGGTPDTSHIFSPTVMFASPGLKTITLTIQTLYGTSTFTKNIYILSCLPPTANFLLPAFMCQGFCLDSIINTSTESPFTTCAWTFTNGNPTTSSAVNPKHICFDNAGIFNITLVATNIYGSGTITLPITVLPAPQILNNDIYINAGNTVELEAVPAYGGQVTWVPSTYLSNPDSNITVCTPLGNIFYTVKDTASCPSPDTVYVYVIFQNVVLMVPNAFTPNNNGLNDVFRIKSNAPLLDFELSIFNRWGERVYNTLNQESGWDGTYQGKEQNSGVFVYTVSYRDWGNNEIITKKGNLTLIK
jgi:gliding motility-associated-like protein